MPRSTNPARAATWTYVVALAAVSGVAGAVALVAAPQALLVAVVTLLVSLLAAGAIGALIRADHDRRTGQAASPPAHGQIPRTTGGSHVPE